MDVSKETRPHLHTWLLTNPAALDFTNTEVTAQMLNETVTYEVRFWVARLCQMILKEQILLMKKTYTNGEHVRVVLSNQELLEVLQEHRCYALMTPLEEKAHKKHVEEENAKRRKDAAAKPRPK